MKFSRIWIPVVLSLSSIQTPAATLYCPSFATGESPMQEQAISQVRRNAFGFYAEFLSRYNRTGSYAFSAPEFEGYLNSIREECDAILKMPTGHASVRIQKFAQLIVDATLDIQAREYPYDRILAVSYLFSTYMPPLTKYPTWIERVRGWYLNLMFDTPSRSSTEEEAKSEIDFFLKAGLGQDQIREILMFAIPTELRRVGPTFIIPTNEEISVEDQLAVFGLPIILERHTSLRKKIENRTLDRDTLPRFDRNIGSRRIRAIAKHTSTDRNWDSDKLRALNTGLKILLHDPDESPRMQFMKKLLVYEAIHTSGNPELFFDDDWDERFKVTGKAWPQTLIARGLWRTLVAPYEIRPTRGLPRWQPPGLLVMENFKEEIERRYPLANLPNFIHLVNELTEKATKLGI